LNLVSLCSRHFEFTKMNWKVKIPKEKKSLGANEEYYRYKNKNESSTTPQKLIKLKKVNKIPAFGIKCLIYII